MKQVLLILSILLFSVCSLQAQNCECSIHKNSLNKIDKALDEADYVYAEQLAISIINDSSLTCKILGLNELFNVYVPLKKWQKTEALLKEQYRLIGLADCNVLKFWGDYYLNMSIYYYKTSRYTASVDYCYKSISIKEKLNDIEGILKARQILAQTLSYMNRDMEAAKMVIDNYSLITQSQDSYDKAQYIIWLIKNYEVFYNQTGNEAYLDTMVVLCEVGRGIAKKYENRDALIENYLMSDIIMYYKGNYAAGLKFLDSALMVVNYKKDGRELARIHLSMAWEHISMGNKKQAYFEHDSAMFYFQNYYQSFELSSGYTDGAEIYAMGGDYKTAFEYHLMGLHIRDSVSSVNTSNKIAELEQKYNKQVNEQKIEDLSHENEIAYQKQKVSDLRLRLSLGIILLIILLITISVFIVRQRILSQKKEKLEIEQRLNRSRMNPHFFFNALTSLQKMALEPERHLELSSYLVKYSKIMRQTLESTYHELVPLEEELDYIDKYLQLQKLRFPTKFEFSIEIADEVDSFETLVPSMILQPFVENSIEHGFHGITYQGILKISAKKVGNEIHLCVVDNGSKVEEHSLHDGYPSRAVQIIRDRLRLFNSRYRSNARFKAEKRTNEPGYKVEITLPCLSGVKLK